MLIYRLHLILQYLKGCRDIKDRPVVILDCSMHEGWSANVSCDLARLVLYFYNTLRFAVTRDMSQLVVRIT